MGCAHRADPLLAHMATVRYPAYAMLSPPPRCAAFLTLTLLLTACGDDVAPEIEVPSWAHVAPEQIAEAKKHLAFPRHSTCSPTSLPVQ